MLNLIDGGRGRFYVRVPDDFRCEYKLPKDYFGHKVKEPEHQSSQEKEPSFRNAAWPTYMQLDRTQVQELIIGRAISITQFNNGALFLRLNGNGVPSINFDHQAIRAGVLKPEGKSVADAVPIILDRTVGSCMVVKSLMPNSNIYSYSLQGVDFSSVYVEEIQATKRSFNFECNSEAVKIMLEIAERRLDKLMNNSIIENELAPPLANGKRNRNGEIFDKRRAKLAAHLTDWADANISQGSSGKRDREFNEELIDGDIRSTRFSVPFKLLLTATRWWESEPRASADLISRLETMGFTNRYGGAEDEVPHITRFITGKSLTALNKELSRTVKKKGR
jgi:hypothetical protein